MNYVDGSPSLATGLKRYDHNSPAEIITLLTRVVRSHAAVSIQGAGEHLNAVVDSVHITHPHLLVKCEDGAERVEAALRCEKLLFSVEIGAARLEFSILSRGISSAREDNMMVVPLPTRMLRFDRREHLRVTITESKPVSCELHLTDGTKLLCKAYDLSAGGIGLTTSSLTAVLVSGLTLANCRLHLPGVGVPRVDVEIRHRVEEALPEGGNLIGLGCRFLNLSESNAQTIQEFIRGYDMMAGLALGSASSPH
jgi:c-di-GMP-binding flagellar brake protein YcgR